MKKLIYVASHGEDDPARATLPFVCAMGAMEAGYEAEIWLTAGAVALVKDYVARAVQAPGWPPAEELMALAVNNGARIRILDGGARHARITERDLTGKRASVGTPAEFAAACADSAAVVSV